MKPERLPPITEIESESSSLNLTILALKIGQPEIRRWRPCRTVQMLQVAINEAQKKRLVAEIVETDHFQQLQKRAAVSLDAESFSPFPASPSGLCKIVSIHSFRGGTGKSNLTSNLAISIASQGRRVGIVDTDIQSPGIHTLFGLDQETIDRTLNDYLWERCAIHEAAYDVSYVMLKRQNLSNSL